MREKGRVLVIAGFDPSGGAGLLMDVKVFTLFGFRACSVPTALTFQSSRVFEDWVFVDLKAFERMLKLTLEDEVPEGMKIGMLSHPEIIEIATRYLKKYRSKLKWVVLDPVLKASLRKPLFKGEDFLEVLKKKLFPLVEVITPNVEETERLSHIKIDSEREIKRALYFFRELGVKFPVITGFEKGDKRTSFFLDEREKFRRVSVKGIPHEFHGTGCAFSSALLAYLLKGYEISVAVKKATFWLYKRLSRKKAFPQKEGLKMIF